MPQSLETCLWRLCKGRCGKHSHKELALCMLEASELSAMIKNGYTRCFRLPRLEPICLGKKACFCDTSCRSTTLAVGHHPLIMHEGNIRVRKQLQKQQFPSYPDGVTYPGDEPKKGTHGSMLPHSIDLGPKGFQYYCLDAAQRATGSSADQVARV